jgi:hypothetical protein
MRRFIECMCLVAVIGFSGQEAVAERKPLSEEEKKQEATHIVSGKVEAIYKQEKPVFEAGVKTVRTNFVVQLSVSAVEMGEGPKAEQRLYVHCFKLKDAVIGKSGHNPLPEEGDQVRVFLTRSADGRYEVVYPNGFEQAGDKAR